MENISARIVIRADGSWEGGIGRLDHKPSDLLAFKAHFRNCSLPPDLMPLLAFRSYNRVLDLKVPCPVNDIAKYYS